ncbi:MAG: hypothetical protein H6978_01940 [Gammaproteobacteria bacterium]|nr:hypothetical protein [Gammaproteobacteria bacterium]
MAEFNNGFSGSSADYSSSYSAVRFLHDKIKASGGEGIKDVMTYLTNNQSATLKHAIASTAAYSNTDVDAAYNAFVSDFTTNGAAFIQAFDYANSDTGAIGGLDVDGGALKTAESAVLDYGTRSTEDVLSGFNESFEELKVAKGAETTLTFQVGANFGERVDATVGSMSTQAMGISAVDLVGGAQRAIGQIDRALDYINTERAKLGAQLARFETTISNLQTSTENVTASRSRIVDADFAAETAELTRNSILQQAGTAMLAQANVQHQIALQLLR